MELPGFAGCEYWQCLCCETRLRDSGATYRAGSWARCTSKVLIWPGDVTVCFQKGTWNNSVFKVETFWPFSRWAQGCRSENTNWAPPDHGKDRAEITSATPSATTCATQLNFPSGPLPSTFYRSTWRETSAPEGPNKHSTTWSTLGCHIRDGDHAPHRAIKQLFILLKVRTITGYSSAASLCT